jgi:uncharacterized protein (DUF885 family)
MGKLNLILLFLVISTLIISCNKTGDKNTIDDSKATKQDTAFQKISDEFITGYLEWRPQQGTALGLHEYDGKISDYSKESIEKEISRLKSYRDKLSSIDTSGLSPKMFYDLRILKQAIDKELFSFEEMASFTNNPMTYAGVLDINIYITRNFAPIEERLRSIIGIEKRAGDIFKNARANLNESMPRPYITTAIEIAKGSASFLGKNVLPALKDVQNKELLKEFGEVNSAAITELNNFAEFLKNEKLPKANENYSLGREKYQKMLKTGEMIDYTPEQILEIGLKELKKEQDEFAEIAKRIDPTKKPIDVFKEIQKDHPTEESLIPDTRKNMENIYQFLINKKIVTLPNDVRAKVEETPEFLRATTFATMDTPGPFEKKATEAYYYVTPVDKKWDAKQKDEWLTAFNFYTTDVVSIHEAYPGHYIQFLHLNASPATKLEKIFGSYAFIEGWAHYTEQMLIDEGYSKDKDSITYAKYKLAQLDEALLRICRLCVSIKMHTQGMTTEEGTKFFTDNCYYEKQPASSESNRGTYDPGYLYYKLGKMQIYKLREDYKKQEGSNYSLQKFHDTMLDNGMPPIRLLREVLLKDKSKWGEIL